MWRWHGAACPQEHPLEAWLADIGFEPEFGARPLKRAIQREVQDPLALKILSGEFREGDAITLDAGSDGLVFRN